MNKLSLSALFATLTLTATAAHAQYAPRVVERNRSAGEAARSAARVRDDARDLARFDATLRAFDDAMRRRDPVAVRGTLQSFVGQARAELVEQQRETAQAHNEAARSRVEVRGDRRGPGRRDDRRDARDDVRDARQEERALQEETALVNELERLAGAEVSFGPQAGIVVRARQAMVRFTQLAAEELRRSQRELREDNRELREDNRALRRPRY